MNLEEGVKNNFTVAELDGTDTSQQISTYTSQDTSNNIFIKNAQKESKIDIYAMGGIIIPILSYVVYRCGKNLWKTYTE